MKMKVKCGSGGESYTEGDLHFGAVMNLYVWRRGILQSDEMMNAFMCVGFGGER